MCEKMLRGLDVREHVVLFEVWSDSFDLYLGGRRIAGSIGVRYGREPFTTDQTHQYLLGRSNSGSSPEVDSVPGLGPKEKKP